MMNLRKIVAILAFSCLIFISLLIISKPLFDSAIAFQTSMAILFVGLFLGGSAIWVRANKLVFVAIIAGLIAIPFVILARAFGSFVVISLVFHAQFGISGADFAGFEQEIFDSIFYVCLVVFSAYAISNILKTKQTLYWLTAAALVGFNPLTWYIVEVGANQNIESDLHLSLEEPVLETPEVLPDIVFIYLEGVERQYGNASVFGDIYAPIEAYEDRGVTFTNVLEINGTGWSLAGLVATQCGVPLVPNGLRFYSKLDQQAEFMPKRKCLNQLVRDMGYETSFVMGGTQHFGGYDHFFALRNFDNIVDRPAIARSLTSDEAAAALTGWVLDDQSVFDASRHLYDRKRQQDAPMLLMLATYGPHGSTAVVSRGCTETGQAGLAPDLLTAISCTLKDTVSFLDHVIANHRDRPTIVIVASDHLNHDPAMAEMFTKEERSNTLIMFSLGIDDPLLPPGTRVDKPGSMIDVYPTILAYAGFAEANVRAGLGRSLLGDAPTIMESKGLGRFNAELFPNPLLNEAVWGQ